MNTELKGLPTKTMSKQKLSDSLNKKYLKTKIQNVLSQKSLIYSQKQDFHQFFLFLYYV